MDQTRLTAGVYARLSLASDASSSIAQQLHDGRLRAEQLGAHVVVEGVDNSVSASSTKPWDRQGWRDVVEAQPNIIIIREQSRIARSVADWAQVVTWCRDSGVRLLTLDQEFDLGTASGQMIANVLASFSQYEAQLIGERIRYSRNEMIRNGRRPGGRRPWPMRLADNPDGPGYVLRPDPDRAGIVVEIVEKLEQGESLLGVCRWLQAEGIKSPNGGYWQSAALRVMLKSPTLAGATVNRGKLVLDKAGAVRIDEDQKIIDLDRWLKLKAMLDDRGRGYTPPTPSLLQGLLRCSTCGSTMGYAPSAKPPAYRCRNAILCSRRVSIEAARADAEYVDTWLDRYGSAQEELPRVGADPVEIAKLREGLASIKAALPEAAADQVMPLIEQRDRLEQDLVRAQTKSIGRTIQVGRYRIESWLASQGTGRTWAEKYQDASQEGLEAAHSVLAEAGVTVTVLPGVRGGSKAPRLQFPDEG